MRILELCEFYSNYSGNFIPSLEALKDELELKGHKIFYIFSNKNTSKKFFEWEVPFSKKHSVKLVNFDDKNIIDEVVNFINEKNIDIVHGHFLSSKLFSDIKKKTNKNVVFYQHIHNSFYLKKNIYAFLKRMRNLFFLDCSITKICCSESIVASARYTFPHSPIISVKNAIDFSRLEKKNCNRLQKNNILLFGHNYFIKGVDIAIESIISLAEEYDAHLDIVMGDRAKENKKIIEEKYGKVPNCISLLEPTNNVTKLYQEHQIFLNASQEEGMSYANIEAYYSGCLFVSSDIPQNREPNLPGVIYFKNRDIEDLKRALIDAFNSKNQYANDFDYVERNFSTKTWAKQIIKIFGI